MFEVERKYPLPSHEAVVQRLQASGATEMGTHRQEDTFFSHPERDMAASDEALRLRREDGRMELTWKGPRLQGGGVKARVEETVGVDSDPTALLGGLGYRPTHRLAKRRATWKLGDVTVALDEVEGLGLFAEVEVVASSVDDARQRVDETAARLGLSGPVEASYLELSLRR